MESLQLLAATKFVLKFLENSKVTLTKVAPGRTAATSIKFEPPKSSEMLEASKPLWLFSLIDDALEQIAYELSQWAKNNLPHFLYEDDVVLRLSDFRFRNALIDYRETALRLADCENLSWDERLIVAVLFGQFAEARRVCEAADRIGAKFKFETSIAMYRRLASGEISPADVMSTVSARIRFPAGFLSHIEPSILQSFNFVDTLRRLIVEYLYDPCPEVKALLNTFLASSQRSIGDVLPPLLKSIIPNFLADRRRCELLLAISTDLCGESVVRTLIDQWPNAASTFSELEGLYLAVVRHPMLADKLIHLLELNDFRIAWHTLVTLTKQNDFVMERLLRIMPEAKMMTWLKQQDYELFHHLCDTNARRTIRFLRDSLDKANFDDLVESRDYSCFMSACKRGHFLIVKLLTDNMDADQWERAFGYQNYEAFYLATKSGYLAVVEWFGMLCAKFGLKSKYEEAHMITLRMLEIEAKMLETALNVLKSPATA